MPKRLAEYSLKDHLRCRPLTQAIKTMRYRRIDRAYLARPAREPDRERAAREAVAGKRVLVTIAFNDAEILGWQLALIRRFVPADLHIVADNSSSEAAAAEIAGITTDAGAIYLRLPQNPWTGRNSSRSHGLAMNRVWHCVLKPGRPDPFGFLDADLLPTAPDDPFAVLEGRAFHGDHRWADGRWYLWAGYCFFRFAAVADRPLDFGLDWFRGLDTGGANWEVLYRDVDPVSIRPGP